MNWEFFDLTLAYSNPNPQLDGLLKRLSGPSPDRGPETGPMAPGSPDEPPSVAYPPAPPRALGKRLSLADSDTLIAAFNAGASQQHLAAEFGISVRSVKRLVHGNSNRPQATANRLTPDQRRTIAHTYATACTHHAEKSVLTTSAPLLPRPRSPPATAIGTRREGAPASDRKVMSPSDLIVAFEFPEP